MYVPGHMTKKSQSFTGSGMKGLGIASIESAGQMS